MKTRVLMATVGGAAAALAAGVMWTAPSASAGSDFCNSLPTPEQIHDCSCGADNVPGTQEYQQCLHGHAAAPGPASSPPPLRPPPNPCGAGLAVGAANREGASVLGLVAADELSVLWLVGARCG